MIRIYILVKVWQKINEKSYFVVSDKQCHV